MQRQTYSVVNEKETLVYEETYDDNNNLIHYIDHQARPVSEKKFEYDEKNQITKESELSEGVELQRLELNYNDKGDVVEQNLFFSGEIYESIKTVATENGFIRTTFQDGDEVYRVESTTEGKNFTNKHYNYEELVNVEVSTFDEETITSEKIIYDAEENVLVRRVEVYNEEKELVIFKEFNANNQLVNKSEVERKDGKVFKEIKSDFVRGEIDNEIHYDYDEKGNLIKTETRTNSGQLIDFQVKVYDEQNRVVEESGVSNGKFNAIYGTYIDGSNYHFVHRYV
jgi:hypothetical protein